MPEHQPKRGPTNGKQCAASRKDGRPCTAPALSGPFCFAHDPDREQERAEARRRGGKGRSTIARLHAMMPRDLRGVYETLGQAMTEVHQGELDPRKASAMASIARAMVAVLEAGDFEERLRRLEELQKVARHGVA